MSVDPILVSTGMRMTDLTANLSLALAPKYYTDPEIYAREHESIFFKTWQFIAHESIVAAPGDYKAFTVFDQSLFLIRDKDGEVRCFYNVCAHRAHELLEGEGRVKRVVCPYHAWTYTTDGRLMGAPASDKVPGFNKSDICLSSVRVEVFNGFIFINFDENARPMDEWFPGVRESLRAYVPNIDKLQVYENMAVEENCNWKVSIENYSECYHCALNHPTFSNGVIDPVVYDISPDGGHVLHHTTVAANLDRMTYPVDMDVPHAGDYSSWFLWPSMSFQVYPGNVLNTYRFIPTGVENVRVERGWYTDDGHDAPMIDTLAQQDLNTTVAEDIRLVESVQRGLKSRGYRPGPLVIDPAGGVNSEHSIHALNTWVLDALGDNAA